MKAKISEIFKSIQGEGVYQGIEQAFIRFWGCDFACSFCDTKDLSFDDLTISQILDQVYSYGRVHSVALTGGEPLVQITPLVNVARALKEKGYRVYLETNGINHWHLAEVVEYVDIVAMDFKLPSTTARQPVWEAHERFLEIAASSCDVFVKAVIGPNTQVGDILESIKIIQKINPDSAFVLQPQNPFEADLGTKLSFFKMLAAMHNIQTYIREQKHKRLGIR